MDVDFAKDDGDDAAIDASPKAMKAATKAIKDADKESKGAANRIDGYIIKDKKLEDELELIKYENHEEAEKTARLQVCYMKAFRRQCAQTIKSSVLELRTFEKTVKPKIAKYCKHVSDVAVSTINKTYKDLKTKCNNVENMDADMMEQKPSHFHDPTPWNSLS